MPNFSRSKLFRCYRIVDVGRFASRSPAGTAQHAGSYRETGGPRLSFQVTPATVTCGGPVARVCRPCGARRSGGERPLRRSHPPIARGLRLRMEAILSRTRSGSPKPPRASTSTCHRSSSNERGADPLHVPRRAPWRKHHPDGSPDRACAARRAGSSPLLALDPGSHAATPRARSTLDTGPRALGQARGRSRSSSASRGSTWAMNSVRPRSSSSSSSCASSVRKGRPRARRRAHPRRLDARHVQRQRLRPTGPPARASSCSAEAPEPPRRSRCVARPPPETRGVGAKLGTVEREGARLRPAGTTRPLGARSASIAAFSVPPTRGAFWAWSGTTRGTWCRGGARPGSTGDRSTAARLDARDLVGVARTEAAGQKARAERRRRDHRARRSF